jgi:hypothetical protein
MQPYPKYQKSYYIVDYNKVNIEILEFSGLFLYQMQFNLSIGIDSKIVLYIDTTFSFHRGHRIVYYVNMDLVLYTHQ